jgi:nitroreductase
MALIPVIENWQSIKQYSDDPVDKEALERVLEAGRKAPSAKNRQPWRFIVVDDESTRKRMEAAAFGQEHVGRAPVIIAACTTNVDYRMPNGQWSYPIDLTMAVSFMMLQASEEGLGSCVVTTYDEQEIKDILTVPYSMRVVMLLLVGQPAGKPFPTQRKPLKRIASYNHW